MAAEVLLEKIAIDALELIAKHPDMITNILDSELALPNIPTPTLGGKVFWITLAEYKGFRIQQNQITHHARILNPDDVRIAWGTINGMIKALNRMVEMSKAYRDD